MGLHGLSINTMLLQIIIIKARNSLSRELINNCVDLYGATI